ncbi:hypothetical protein SprV_0301088400 [Sparganum proliferum]
MDHLTTLFQEVWRQGEVLQNLKDATIVHLRKRKGNRQLSDKHRGISLPSSSAFSSTATTSDMPISITHSSDTPKNTKSTTINTSDEDPVYTCPHCNRTLFSHIGKVGHLRIYPTETSEAAPGAPTCTRRIRLYYPHYPRTFRHRMGLFGHMPIHESGNDRSPDTHSTSTTPIMHSPAHTPQPSAPTAAAATTTTTTIVADTDTTDFSFPHCPLTFTSRTGLVDHV